MIEEINSAVNFLPRIMNFRFSGISRQLIEKFIQSLTAVLLDHYNNHWFPDMPTKGSGYRCLRIVKHKMDPLFAKACRISGLTVEHLSKLLPPEFTMWIDPADVSYRIGENGSIGVVYHSQQASDSDSTGFLSSDESSDGDDSSSEHPQVAQTACVSRATLQTFNNVNLRYLTTAVAS